jgi:polyferredoxin
MNPVVRVAAQLLRIRRGWVQAGAALVTNSAFPSFLKHVPCPGLNCYSCPAASFACPIGGLQHFSAARQVPLYLGAMLGLTGLVTGRLTCGWLCPFGWLQDLAYRLPTRKWSPRVRLKWLRFAMLAVFVLLLPFLTGEQWFSKICPAGTLEAGIPWVLLSAEVRKQAGWLFAFKVATLAGLLGWMTVTRRPFCRYFCPLGAVYALFNPISLLRVSAEPHACSSCGQCKKACPVEIDPLTSVNSMECIHCMECVRACPSGVLRLGRAGHAPHANTVEVRG